MTEETWVDIPKYVGLYQVSNLGNVRHLPYVINHGRYERPIKMRNLRAQYPAGVAIVRLVDHAGLKHQVPIKQLVARAFLVYPPDKILAIGHRDGDYMNCHVDNLVFISDEHNEKLELQHTLSGETVAELRRMAQEGVTYKELAQRYRRSRSAICRIVNGSRYPGKRENQPEEK